MALPTKRTREGLDPNAYKLFVKAGYDPSEPSALGKLPSEDTTRKAREGLSYRQPPPIHISIRRSSNNHITFEDDVTAPYKRPSVFDRLGKATTRIFVFERLGPLKKNNKNLRSYLKVTTPDSHLIRKYFRSLIPSRMRRRVELVVSCKEELKAKVHSVVYTKERKEDEESVEEDAKNDPPELEEGVKITIDPLKEVNLGTDEDPKPTYLSAFLEIDEEFAYMNILKEYRYVFTYCYKEMPGLNPRVAVHQLAVKNGSRLVKQAQRRFRPDLIPLIENEVNKLIEAGFICEKNDQIRVFVDFRDLNNACPKDEFPLPIPELMIDATIGYESMSFMDGSSGYNQIRMSPKDEELTAFRTPKDHPIPNDWELTDELPDEDAMLIEVQPPWKMYFDGAAHRGGAGAGVVFISSQEEIVPFSFTLKQCCSNNVAEYQALILGLEMAHVRRTENKKDDALATLASTLTLPNQTQMRRKIGDNPSLTTYVMGYFQKIQEEELTYVVVHLVSFTTRIHYIEDHLRVCYYDVWERKKRFKPRKKHTLCGSHQSGPKLHFHIKRMGYYWPTMVKDCLYYARKCDACQFHVNFIHQPPEVLHPTIASWSFDAWGLDIVGSLPKSSGGQWYILAATDYFSKWAEVVALKEVKKENVANFIRVNIIYCFGIPRYIITDNVKPFDNKLMNKICDLFDFKQRKSSVYHAAPNGLAEEFNKTICNLLKKVVSKSKRDWHERMEEALWAYRTTYRTPTQATPYSLAFGVEAVLPLEHQIPSLRQAIQEGLTEEENARLRLVELEALDEKRLEAQQNLECYQARLSRAFNKKVCLRCFQVGDQVLAVRRPIITSHKSWGKFTSKWDGPYVIQEAYSHGAYKLVDADGLRIGPINAKFLKRYYP
ncbi:uncharacterized protein [Solanum lycopersicum]|uniref:uncharacterized protein n=1 Tax=Solanum lycopersicum TaxID=4081 RepID=UPI0037487D29